MASFFGYAIYAAMCLPMLVKAYRFSITFAIIALVIVALAPLLLDLPGKMIDALLGVKKADE